MDSFLDSYIESDLSSGRITESDAQEVVDQLLLKANYISSDVFPKRGSPASAGKARVRLSIGASGIGGHGVTRTTHRFLNSLETMGRSLGSVAVSVRWGGGEAPEGFKVMCARASIASSPLHFLFSTDRPPGSEFQHGSGTDVGTGASCGAWGGSNSSKNAATLRNDEAPAVTEREDAFAIWKRAFVARSLAESTGCRLSTTGTELVCEGAAQPHVEGGGRKGAGGDGEGEHGDGSCRGGGSGMDGGRARSLERGFGGGRGMAVVGAIRRQEVRGALSQNLRGGGEEWMPLEAPYVHLRSRMCAPPVCASPGRRE